MKMDANHAHRSTSWYKVRKSRLLVLGVAIWYSLVPVLSVNSVVGYFARVSIVLFVLIILSKKITSRFLEGRMPIGATFLTIGLTAAAITNAVGAGEIRKLIDFIVFFGGVAGYFLLADRYPLNEKDALAFTVTLLAAGVLLEVTGAPGTRGEFGLVPFTGQNWKVLIKAPHFTGWGGVFLLFTSLLMSRKKGWELGPLLLFLLGWYLIILSGSRSSIAAALATVALWFSGTARRTIMQRRYLGVLITLLAGLSMYVVPILVFDALRAEGFLGRLLKISPGQEDVTAGRFLTWIYHLELFFENLWTGAKTSMVTESADTVRKELAASNESFFTKVLARHGIFGLLFHSLFLFLSWYSISRKSFEAFVLSVVFSIITAASGVFGSTYGVYSILGYWLFFSLVVSSSGRTHR